MCLCLIFMKKKMKKRVCGSFDGWMDGGKGARDTNLIWLVWVACLGCLFVWLGWSGLVWNGWVGWAGWLGKWMRGHLFFVL